MTREEAIQFTIETAQELSSVLRVEILYPTPENNLKGVFIHFFGDWDSQQNVFEKMHYLGLSGIRFDVYGNPAEIVWQLDWSFQYEKGNLQEEFKMCIAELQDIIGSMLHSRKRKI